MIEKEKKTLKKIVDERKTKPENKTSEQNCYQNRVNPPDPPAVKIPETESIAFELAENDRGNQKTGNDEKNIDTDETAAYDLRKSVENENGENGQRPQSIDIRAVTGRFGVMVYGTFGGLGYGSRRHCRQ